MATNQDILDYLSKIFRSGDATTPKHIVDAMLDLIPDEVFRDPAKTFLCPATKDGVFLREILQRILKAYKTNDETKIRKVLETRIFGIALTFKDYMMSRRTLYGCTDDENETGYRDIDNIFYDTTETLSEPQKDKLGNTFPYQYTFIKTDEYLEKAKNSNAELVFQVKGNDDKILYEKTEKLFDKLNTLKNMKFDVIIGNPPYQLSDGGAQASAMPIYHKFIQQAKIYNPCYISMIIPSRWFTGGRGLDEFRNEMLDDNRIRTVVDYFDSTECFPMVDISGGVCYFLWNRDNKGDCKIISNHSGNKSVMDRPLLEKNSDIFIRFNEAISIIRKINSFNEKSFSEIVSSQKPFGLRTYIQGTREHGVDSVKLYSNRNVCKETGYISRKEIPDNEQWIDSWKVYISAAYGERGSFPYLALGKPFLGEPNTCCTETFQLIGPFPTKHNAENVIEYIKTRFFRFLVLQIKNTQHAPKKVYQFVPMQDFNETWSDKKLYAKYGLNQEEIGFIERMIRPMDLNAIEEREVENGNV